MENLITACLPAHWYVLTAAEWAAWVQAAGSIIALVVAIFVMSRQNRHAAKLIADADRLTTLRRAQSVHALVLRAAKQLTNVRRQAEIVPVTASDLVLTKVQLKISIEITGELLGNLKAIPTYDLGSFDMAEGVHRIIEAASTIMTTLRAIEPEPSQVGASHVVESNRSMLEMAGRGVALFEKGMNELK